MKQSDPTDESSGDTDEVTDEKEKQQRKLKVRNRRK